MFLPQIESVISHVIIHDNLTCVDYHERIGVHCSIACGITWLVFFI